MAENTAQTLPGGRSPPAESRRGFTRAQWLVLAAAVLGWMFDGVEIGLPPIMGRPAIMELLGPEARNDPQIDQKVAPLLGVLGAMFLSERRQAASSSAGSATGWAVYGR